MNVRSQPQATFPTLFPVEHSASDFQQRKMARHFLNVVSLCSIVRIPSLVLAVAETCNAFSTQPGM